MLFVVVCVAVFSHIFSVWLFVVDDYIVCAVVSSVLFVCVVVFVCLVFDCLFALGVCWDGSMLLVVWFVLLFLFLCFVCLVVCCC